MAACGAVEDETTTTDNGLYGFGDNMPRWGTTNGAVIPVCWADPNKHAVLHALTQKILQESWPSYANITFSWTNCGAYSRMIEVSFSDEVDYRGWSGPIPAGTGVILRAAGALTENAAIFRYQVIHEFGHALGFAHEQQRPDNWDGVADKCHVATTHPDYGNYAPVQNGMNLTAEYDDNSVMNYCYPGSAPQDLSVGDIAGVRAAYGRRDVKGNIYALQSDGDLRWYRHDGRPNGSYTWALGSGTTIRTGFFVKDMFSGGNSDGVLYAVDGSNQLRWYRHDGRLDGGDRWAPLPAPNNIAGTGWDFTKLFGAGDGIIYGITPYVPAHWPTEVGGHWTPASGGQLKWYRHTGRNTGTFQWAPGSGNVVGDGWHTFEKVFSGGDGVIYAITPYVPAQYPTEFGGQYTPASGGELKWYRHVGRADGTYTWATGSGAIIKRGMQDYQQVFSGGDGVIYAIDSANQLHWLRHDGRLTGSATWAAGSGSVVGDGWDFFDLVGDD